MEKSQAPTKSTDTSQQTNRQNQNSTKNTLVRKPWTDSPVISNIETFITNVTEKK